MIGLGAYFLAFFLDCVLLLSRMPNFFWGKTHPFDTGRVFFFVRAYILIRYTGFSTERAFLVDVFSNMFENQKVKRLDEKLLKNVLEYIWRKIKTAYLCNAFERETH